jgi:two-component system response regulator MprA
VVLARILVVDDEPDLLYALERALGEEGYQVASAASGELALAAIAASPPDLIVTDVMLPGIDGYELIGRLRRQGYPTPVVVMSAAAQPVAGLANVRYLRKPFDLDDLLATIAVLLTAG